MDTGRRIMMPFMFIVPAFGCVNRLSCLSLMAVFLAKSGVFKKGPALNWARSVRPVVTPLPHRKRSPLCELLDDLFNLFPLTLLRFNPSTSLIGWLFGPGHNLSCLTNRRFSPVHPPQMSRQPRRSHLLLADRTNLVQSLHKAAVNPLSTTPSRSAAVFISASRWKTATTLDLMFASKHHNRSPGGDRSRCIPARTGNRIAEERPR
jgi:hypothetical protein